MAGASSSNLAARGWEGAGGAAEEAAAYGGDAGAARSGHAEKKGEDVTDIGSGPKGRLFDAMRESSRGAYQVTSRPFGQSRDDGACYRPRVRAGPRDMRGWNSLTVRTP